MREARGVSAVWLITGAQASGKSTVADLLARRFDRGVHVRGGEFYRWGVSGWANVGDPGADEREVLRLLDLRYRLASMAADEYAAAGFTAVVQDNIYGAHVEEWIDRITARPVHLVVLRPRVEVIAARDAERQARSGKVAYRGGFTPEINDEHVAGTRHDLGLWLDTSNQTPEQTVDEILRRVSDARVALRTGTAAMLRPTTDGLVTIRPPTPGDAARLVAGRDAEFHRFLGPGADVPDPLGCIVVGGDVVGWVDHDRARDWLEPGEVNLGYHLFASARGQGLATRAVQLLMHHLAVDSDATVATFLIDRDNERSQRLARRVGAVKGADLDGHPYFKRPVPSIAYTDGVVTIRPLGVGDLERDLEAKDDEQIRWLWQPGERELWEAMNDAARREHVMAYLAERREQFATGPRWAFAVDTADEPCVAFVECNLANRDVPSGEANISYSAHPAHRGRGHVARAACLALTFLAEHTGAREAHVIVDAENAASLRVATSVGATEVDQFVNEHARAMIRHVLAVRPASSN